MKRRETKTVGDLFERFLDEKKLANMTKATLTNYLHYFSLYNQSQEISEKLITEFSHEYLYNWHKTLDKVKPRTVKQYISSMRVFHLWLFEEGYLPTPPKHIYIKLDDTIPRYYTQEEIKSLISKPNDKASFEEYSTYIMICFLLATGVRASTLIEIKLSDLDFDNNLITLRHLKNRTKAIIPMSDKLHGIIYDYLHEFIRESKDSYLFCDRNERQISTQGLRGRLTRYCKKRGVEFKDLHAFRHSYAHQYVHNGGSIEKLQKLLTHKSLQTTAYYANIFGKDLQVGYEEICPLDNLLSRHKVIHRSKSI